MNFFVVVFESLRFFALCDCDLDWITRRQMKKSCISTCRRTLRQDKKPLITKLCRHCLGEAIFGEKQKARDVYDENFIGFQIDQRNQKTIAMKREEITVRKNVKRSGGSWKGEKEKEGKKREKIRIKNTKKNKFYLRRWFRMRAKERKKPISRTLYFFYVIIFIIILPDLGEWKCVRWLFRFIVNQKLLLSKRKKETKWKVCNLLCTGAITMMEATWWCRVNYTVLHHLSAW